MYPKILLPLTLAIIAAGALPLARATPITYSERGAWQSQVISPTIVDFETVGDGSYWLNDTTAAGYGSNGATFVAYKFLTPGLTEYYTQVVNNTYGQARDFGTGAVLDTVNPQWSPISPAYIAVQFPSSTAFGFDVMTFLPSTGQYAKDVDIWLSDGAGTYYYRINTNARTATPAFFGVVSPTPFTSVKIQAVNAETILDNFSFGSAVAGAPPPPPEGGETPEMATAILIISGLLFLRFGKKKFGSSKAEPMPA
jgi:hypothetical protein